MRQNIKKISGFTIVELLISLLISGIALAYGISGVKASLFEGGARHSIREVSALLEQAALIASSAQSTVLVLFTENSFTDPSRKKTVKIPKHVEATISFSGSSGRSSIYFYPSGAVSAGTVTLKDQNSSCSLTQTLTGARHQECHYVN